MARGFRFEPLAKVASGGTATVYVGAALRDTSGATVALKRPHPHVLDDARQRATLLREAKVAAGLHHPNIVQVREIEEVGGELQLVMDYVEGTALGTLIALEAEGARRMPVPIAVRILLDATAGLVALHEQRDPEGRVLGLVHRDVSPQNILVGIDGAARLTDFGLARAAYDGAPSTTQGTLKGKLGYMAPEYVSHGQVDPGVDVFAMGVVLWETLAGQRLFRGDNEGQTLDRVLHEPAAPLAAIAPELAVFDGLLARALAKDPRDRLASAQALRGELEAITSAAGAPATRQEVGAYVARAASVELDERGARVSEALARRRRRAMLGPGAILLFTVSVLASGAALVRGRSQAPAAPVVTASTPIVASPDPIDASASPTASAAAAVEAPSSVAVPALSPARRGPATSPAARGSAARALPPNPYVSRSPPR
jgi:serine/threonine-protein kinase